MCMKKIFLLFFLLYGVVYGQEEERNTVTQKPCFKCSTMDHQNVGCRPWWKNEKNAVVMIIDHTGERFTGALINTTANGTDNKHYVITANHCLPGGYGYNYYYTMYGPGVHSVGKLNCDNWLFYWHYESPRCTLLTNEPEPIHIFTKGAKIIANSQWGDFALLELYDDPAEEWDVTPYYLGWDRSNSMEYGVTLFHHPQGDIMKVHGGWSVETRTRQYVYGCKEQWEGASLATHLGFWYKGTIKPENGSSGGPLLQNSSRKFIGQHHENDEGDYPVTWISQGKLSWAWEGYCFPNSNERLKDWLDPVGGGTAVTMEGRGCQKTIKLWHSIPQASYHAVEKIISRQIIPNGVPTTYKAGEVIVLEDGFHAEAGSTFYAKIEEYTECIPPPRANSLSQNNEKNDEFAFQENKSQSIQHQFPYEFNLHPNPNRGTFQIETNFPISEISQLKFTNPLGITVYETRNLASNEIQLPNSVPGLYFVVMVLKDGTVLTQKMMVQR